MPGKLPAEHWLPHMQDGLRAIRASIVACPDRLAYRFRHRLSDKERQATRALRIALGVTGDFEPERRWITRGARCNCTLSLDQGRADAADLAPLPDRGWTADGEALHATPEAPLPSGYRSAFDPLDPLPPALAFRFLVGDIEAEDRVAFDNDSRAFLRRKQTWHGNHRKTSGFQQLR